MLCPKCDLQLIDHRKCLQCGWGVKSSEETVKKHLDEIRAKLSQPKPVKEFKRVELELPDQDFIDELAEKDSKPLEPISEKEAMDYFNDEVERLKGREK